MAMEKKQAKKIYPNNNGEKATKIITTIINGMMKKSKIKRSEWLAHAPHRWTFIICRKCLCFEMCTSDQNAFHSNANTSDDNNNHHHHHTNDGIHQVEVICRPLKFKMLDKIDSKQWASERARVSGAVKRAEHWKWWAKSSRVCRVRLGCVCLVGRLTDWLAHSININIPGSASLLWYHVVLLCVLISFNQNGYITDYIHFMLHTLAGMCLWL